MIDDEHNEFDDDEADEDDAVAQAPARYEFWLEVYARVCHAPSQNNLAGLVMSQRVQLLILSACSLQAVSMIHMIASPFVLACCLWSCDRHSKLAQPHLSCLSTVRCAHHMRMRPVLCIATQHA
jgi:hypothetical protein